MILLYDIVDNLQKIDEPEILLENGAGVYNYQYILEMAKLNCVLTDVESQEIDTLILNFDACNFEIEGYLWFIYKFESLVNATLPQNYVIQFSENGDYGIFEVDEEFWL